MNGKTVLRVTFPDGTVIADKKAKVTLAETIKHLSRKTNITALLDAKIMEIDPQVEPCHSVPGTLWRVYQLYGFTEEELDFIIRSALPLASSKNYDIKYRMGDELSAEE